MASPRVGTVQYGYSVSDGEGGSVVRTVHMEVIAGECEVVFRTLVKERRSFLDL